VTADAGEAPLRPRAIVLFAHGARDARWAEPFERLRAIVAERSGAMPVLLAYLELMSPSLDAAVDGLVERGVDDVVVVPVFFGQGGHVRGDLPRIVDALLARHASLTIRVAAAVGEDANVLAAIADYAFRTAAP
jgi:sirohydrochlorin cobaltochelatase